MKKNILLTFDYELFLGKRSGSVDNCLIKPTNSILEMLDKYHIKAIFFIDTTYIKRLEDVALTTQSAKIDYENIIKQLICIAKKGHYLFHHLHPHWLDAKYLDDVNQWDLNNTERFVLGCLNEQERNDLFKYSDCFLSDILRQAQSDNKCNGFRAGGLYIEPFSCFKPFFEKYGIEYEFSVVPGEKKIGEALFYDFTKCPNNRLYSFNENISIEEINGKFVEFPITKIKIKGFTKILNAFYFRLTRNNIQNIPYGNGLSVGTKINRAFSKKSIKKYLSFDIAISVELLNPVLLFLYKKTIKKNDFVHFLSHPKLISKVSLVSLDKLLKYCKENFEIEYDFLKNIGSGI